MPVALARFDVHYIADGDVALFALDCNLALPRRDDENLVAVMHMPPRGRTDAKIDHVAAKIFRLSIADHRLSRPAHLSTSPPGDRRRGIHRFFLQFTNFKYAHDILHSLSGHNYTPRAGSVKRPETRSCGVFVSDRNSPFRVDTSARPQLLGNSYAESCDASRGFSNGIPGYPDRRSRGGEGPHLCLERNPGQRTFFLIVRTDDTRKNQRVNDSSSSARRSPAICRVRSILLGRPAHRAHRLTGDAKKRSQGCRRAGHCR